MKKSLIVLLVLILIIPALYAKSKQEEPVAVNPGKVYVEGFTQTWDSYIASIPDTTIIEYKQVSSDSTTGYIIVKPITKKMKQPPTIQGFYQFILDQRGK